MLIICQHEGQKALLLLLFMVFLFLACFKAFKAETIAANVIIFKIIYSSKIISLEYL